MMKNNNNIDCDFSPFNGASAVEDFYFLTPKFTIMNTDTKTQKIVRKDVLTFESPTGKFVTLAELIRDQKLAERFEFDVFKMYIRKILRLKVGGIFFGYERVN